jgi:hypothetical protein
MSNYNYLDILPGSSTPNTNLPSIGNPDKVNALAHPLPLTVYADDPLFRMGAAEQVAFTHERLGILNIELTEFNVYAAYQLACMDFSFYVNLHQSKNVLSSFLSTPTAKHDSNGNVIAGGDVAPGSHLELVLPRFNLNLERRFGSMIGNATNAVGDIPYYRAKFELVHNLQDYDLQKIVWDLANNDPTQEFYGKLKGNEKIRIRKLYYKTPLSMWRFYGLFGNAVTVLGNLSSYGMWSDDSTFQVIPVWQNRLQAQAYEEAMHVRISNYTFKLQSNKLRIFPVPSSASPGNMWFEFTLGGDLPYEETEGGDVGVHGVNNLSNIPFENIPYDKINEIGKNWIRRYALALSKETLGHTRSKFGTIPFPNGAVTLNGPALLAEGKEEAKTLRDELVTMLKETSYEALAESKAKTLDSVATTKGHIPRFVYLR